MTARRTKQPKTPLLPIDIALPERVLLDGGALFVVLRTLDDLDAFWKAHREQFRYAAEGIGYGEKQHYLNECEWVFGPSKAAVVKAVFRWDLVGISCTWYDWAADEPKEHAHWFWERDEYRKRQQANNAWCEADEVAYQTDCRRRSPATYRGWWVLEDLPDNFSHLDWFDPWGGEEIVDPHLPVETVVRMLQEQTFDSWKESDVGEVNFLDRQGIDEHIAYWRNEQREGCDYYGQENERA
jgi:hypothetical protein